MLSDIVSSRSSATQQRRISPNLIHIDNHYRSKICHSGSFRVNFSKFITLTIKAISSHGIKSNILANDIATGLHYCEKCQGWYSTIIIILICFKNTVEREVRCCQYESVRFSHTSSTGRGFSGYSGDNATSTARCPFANGSKSTH